MSLPVANAIPMVIWMKKMVNSLSSRVHAISILRNSKCEPSTASVPIASACGICSGFSTGNASCRRKKLNRMNARHSRNGPRNAATTSNGANPIATSTAGLGNTQAAAPTSSVAPVASPICPSRPSTTLSRVR